MGAQLLEIETKEENTFIKNYLFAQKSGKFWNVDFSKIEGKI